LVNNPEQQEKKRTPLNPAPNKTSIITEPANSNINAKDAHAKDVHLEPALDMAKQQPPYWQELVKAHQKDADDSGSMERSSS
jgi:hypothetical protein